MSSLVKVYCLRNFRAGEYRGIKGQSLEMPLDLAAGLARGEKPAVKLPAAPKGK